MFKRGSSRSNASDQSNTSFKLVGIVDIFIIMKFLYFIIITVFMVISSHY